MYSDIELKLGRSALRLWAYQFSASLFLTLLYFIFCDFLTLLPSLLKDCATPTGIILGSIYFGQWFEKRFPMMLDDKKIKKMALRSSLISYFGLLIFVFLTYVKDFNFSFKAKDTPYFVLLFFFSLLILSLLYFFTVFSIKLGLKSERKNLEDLS